MAQTTQSLPMPDQTKPGTGVRAASFLKDDFPVIRTATLVFSIVLALSILLVGGSRLYLAKELDARNQAMARRDLALTQVQQAETEKLEIREFQPRYLRLRERGFIGEENRLTWIEAIQDIQKKRQLLPVAYELAAQQALQLDPSVPVGSLQLKGSRISLHMKLWHEMDLFNLLDDLALKGQYVPTECALARNVGDAENPSPSGLDAECKLYWLTLAAPAAGTAEQGGAEAR